MHKLDFLPTCQLAEGLIWDHRHHELLFVDILSCQLYVVDIDSRTYRQKKFDEFVCWIQLTTHPDFYLVGLRTKIILLHRHNFEISLLQNVLDSSSSLRLNDSYVDHAGRLWFGTMNPTETTEPQGALYSWDMRNGLSIHDETYFIANGPTSVNQGQTLIHNDSQCHCMYSYKMENDRISEKHVFKDFSHQGFAPDGMATDERDHIWVALWNGWSIQCLDPQSGMTLLDVKIPARFPTKPCFGGAHLDRLFVSTAQNLEDPNDFGGHLIECPSMGFRGQAVNCFNLEIR